MGKVAKADDCAPDWKDTMTGSHQSLADVGVAVASVTPLDPIRKNLVKACGKFVTAEWALSRRDGPYATGPTVDEQDKLWASVVAFLARTYLMDAAGNRAVWVHSPPKTFPNWPLVHGSSWAPAMGEVERLLESDRGHFGREDEENLASAAMHSLASRQRTALSPL